MTHPFRRDERGFVLSLVIFAVAALSVAGTALYLVVQSESAMADAGAESSRTFHLANAGLARYMAESFGDPTPERVYAMGGGTVTVTAARALTLGDSVAVYLLRSEAEVPDRRIRDLVSRSSVQQYATLRLQPFRPIAGLVVASSDLNTHSVIIDGRDQCATPGAAVAGIAGLRRGNMLGTIDGSPDMVTQTYSSMMDAINLDWAAVTDLSMPFDFEYPAEPWPNFNSTQVAADEYPTTRVDGNLRASDIRSGRGLLVVTGNIELDEGFTWDGAILAGGLVGSTATATVNGALLTGFAGIQSGRIDLRNTRIMFNSCNVRRASVGIAMLSPVLNTWWETPD